MDINNWKSTSYKRKDLQIIPFMLENGYSINFHKKDIETDRVTPEKIPHNPVSFSKDNVTIYDYCKIERNTIVHYWQKTAFVDGHYTMPVFSKNINELI